MQKSDVIVSDEVREAIARHRPVVALESTVIAHGLPRPQNLATAERLEAIVREGGAVPATIAVLGGKFHAGLDADQLRYLANTDGIYKLSRRDLPVAVMRGWDGATTVSTTMWIAHRAGIDVFATGGIGGVHRGSIPDISADLPELAQTPMLVVCSGAKIVLDLAATREWLETYGVTVAGYQCDELPAFYSRTSGLPIDIRIENAAEAAALFIARRELDLPGAVVLTVPVPTESEIAASELQGVLDEALAESAERQLTGREVTPFLLSRMAERSGGATLKTNIALLENNARVATEVAVALAART
ncbi:MAG: pseudouridine-5'-phosphate glycosidase [Pyrinomonadaceae bacterium]